MPYTDGTLGDPYVLSNLTPDQRAKTSGSDNGGGIFDILGAAIFGAPQKQAPPAAIIAPPPPPDPTDDAIRRARLAARRRALIGAGIGSTFISGPLGDLSAPLVGAPSLTGV